MPRGVVEGRGNCLGGAMGLAEKLATMRKLVKKI